MLEAGLLFGIAIDAVNVIGVHARAGGQRSALVSIVFSVIALESFVNEMTEYAQIMAPAPPEAVTFAQIMGDAEEDHASLDFKLKLAHWIVTGRPMDKGSQPYQDFALLMRLRNDLVHTKPNKPFIAGETTNEEAHEALLTRFRNKQILADDRDSGSWTYLVQSRAVAEWSCRTVARVVSEVCSGVSQNSFEKTLRAISEVFQSYVAGIAKAAA
jgi:hypothetical protein